MNIDLLSSEELSKLNSEIDEAQSIVLCCHVNPDGDALGSCLGWAEYLKTRGKSCDIIVPDQYPDFLRWLPGTERIVRYDKRKEEAESLIADADHVFILDLNDLKRTEGMREALELSDAKFIMFDHHLNPVAKTELMVSWPDLSSTCEIVFRVVWQLGGFESVSKNFAIQIYCGMMADTGGFTFNSTRPEIYYIISLLLTKGIDKDRIYRNVYHTFSEMRLRLTGFVLYRKMEYDALRHAAFFTLTRADMKRFHFIKGDAEGLVNMPLQIRGLKLSISLREDTERDNLIMVSLRSVDNFPCNEMAAEFFNGGGHLHASGGRLYCSIDEAVEITRRAIKAYESKLK